MLTEIYIRDCHWWWVSIGSGSGLVPNGTKPLHGPMLTKSHVPYDLTRPQWVNSLAIANDWLKLGLSDISTFDKKNIASFGCGRSVHHIVICLLTGGLTYIMVWPTLWFDLHYGLTYIMGCRKLLFDLHYGLTYIMAWPTLWLDLHYGLTYITVWLTLWFDLHYGMVSLTLWFDLHYDLTYIMTQCLICFLMFSDSTVTMAHVSQTQSPRAPSWRKTNCLPDLAQLMLAHPK